MENSNLLLTYLGILLALLSVAAFFVVRQVFKTRRIEGTLSRLQGKLTKEKGTAQNTTNWAVFCSTKSSIPKRPSTFSRRLSKSIAKS